MECIASNCDCEATKKVQKLWGDQEIIGFCNNHTPDWLKNLAIGEFSPAFINSL
jgi:hypothetical protein